MTGLLEAETEPVAVARVPATWPEIVVPTTAGLKVYEPLAEPHAYKLAMSAVSPEVARERGYSSVFKKAEMKELGFADTQSGTPAMIIPLHGVTGQVFGYQAKRERPRIVGERVVKYETPKGQRLDLDVPPRCRAALGDPTVPLVITEGPIKADAAASHGMCCVAVLGVWAWRGTNDFGGKTALAAWENIALNGRVVYVAFDSDIMSKAPVHEAQSRLRELLIARGASVKVVYFPNLPGGGKVGLDDFLAHGFAMSDVFDLAETALRPLPKVVDEDEAVDTFEDVPEESGAELLDEVRAMFARYVVFPTPEAVDAVALWTLHTHVVAAFDSTPRMAFTAPEKAAGKTRAMEVLDGLVWSPRHALNTSPAALYRLIERERPTVMLDEVDTYLGARTAHRHEELRGIINGGHRRGATVMRMVGEGANMEPREFDTFAPVALAGLGTLPDTVTQRSIVVRMRRRKANEVVEPLRQQAFDAEARPLKRRIAAWGDRNVEALSEIRPPMPPGVTDRPADVWEPLIAVADRVGGHWPARARAACVRFVNEAADDEESMGLRLLADIRSVLTVDRMRSTELVDALVGIEGAPWEEMPGGKSLTPSRLAQRLKEFGIRPSDHRFNDRTAKGYQRSDFEEAWERWLPPPPDEGNAATLPDEATPMCPVTSPVAPVAPVAPIGGTGTEADTDETAAVRKLPAAFPGAEIVPSDAALVDAEDSKTGATP